MVAGGLIRAFAKEDIPLVAKLRKECFRSTEKSTLQEQCAYFEEVFFRNPWYSDALPSLIWQADDGTIKGFLGVVPRQFLMNGRIIQVAVSTSFMVDPRSRSSLIGVHLLKKFFGGPQALSLADVAGHGSRIIWESLGGSTALLHSLYWTRSLRPCRHVIHFLRNRGLPRALSFAARPLTTIGDALLSRVQRSPYFLSKPLGSVEEMTTEAYLKCLSEFTSSRTLWPSYDTHSLQWVLDKVADRKTFGIMRKALVKNQNKEVVGWYVYFLNPGGISQVVQISAKKHSVDLVLDHLFHEALRRGTVALSGRIDPMLIDELSKKDCLIHRDGPFVLVHSKESEILRAIASGDAFLTRLEGEWWMAF